MITFKKRERTDEIRMSFCPEYAGMETQKIINTVKRKGKLNLGYHYILRETGVIEKGIDFELYADYELEGYKQSIYVMVLSEELTDAQSHALDVLADKLSLKVNSPERV